MLKRSSARPLRAVVAAMALSMLVTISFTGTASAVPHCPAPTGGKVFSWGELWHSRGVTMCRGWGAGGLAIAYLQIVQFSEGAKLRLESSPANAPGAYNTTFYKKPVVSNPGSDWQAWIQSFDPVLSPSRLFSQVNAGFFIDDTSANTTALSLPEWRNGSLQSNGWAIANHSDVAWTRPKKALAMDNPNGGEQSVFIADFPTNYTNAQINSTFAGQYDGLVGFPPLASWDTGNGNRTMVGLSYPQSGPGFPPRTAYILSATSMTLAQARDIIVNAGGADSQIQVDGGCSMQMHATTLPVDFPGAACRGVPEVLAVYMGP